VIIDDDRLVDTIAVFVRFVRMNPQLPDDDAAHVRVWRAYADAVEYPTSDR
jgi:hypothetical protein